MTGMVLVVRTKKRMTWVQHDQDRTSSEKHHLVLCMPPCSSLLRDSDIQESKPKCVCLAPSPCCMLSGASFGFSVFSMWLMFHRDSSMIQHLHLKPEKKGANWVC